MQRRPTTAQQAKGRLSAIPRGSVEGIGRDGNGAGWKTDVAV